MINGELVNAAHWLTQGKGDLGRVGGRRSVDLPQPQGPEPGERSQGLLMRGALASLKFSSLGLWAIQRILAKSQGISAGFLPLAWSRAPLRLPTVVSAWAPSWPHRHWLWPLAATLLAAPLGLRVASASSRAATVGLGLPRSSLGLGSGDTGQN